MVNLLSDTDKVKVLIVDDDANEMNSLAIGLRLEGFDAEGVGTGAMALEKMSEKAYSVALIDLMMPEMNGLQLARGIRAAFPNTITIMMSAYHLSPVQLAKADTGVVGFVPKPYCFKDLVDFIRQKLNPAVLVEASTEANDAGFATPMDIPAIMGNI